MARVLVFQHSPAEPLGTLDPMLRERRHRIRYVNFAREPDKQLRRPLDYDALIVLGGPMNVDEIEAHPHLAYETAVIREFVQANRPILGICLGSQLLAAANGSKVYRAQGAELGWHPLQPTPAGRADPLIRHFSGQESIFQWHERTFDLPASAEHIVSGELCPNQAFRIGDVAYGFQFHLECDAPLIERWLRLPDHQSALNALGPDTAQRIRSETPQLLPRASHLAREVFTGFIDLLPEVRHRPRLPSR